MDLIILEDNKELLVSVTACINKSIPLLNIRLATDCASEVLKYLDDFIDPAIFLLDIVIGKTVAGLSVGRKVIEVSCRSKIIYLTNYPNQIIGKPFFKINAYNIIFKFTKDFESELIYTLNRGIKEMAQGSLLVYNDRNSFLSVTLEGIIYIETLKRQKKACIYHENGIFMVNLTLKNLMKKLNGNFFRCHNSYIVNIKKIQRVDKATYGIYLKNNNHCNYSYAKSKEFFQKIKELNP